MTASSARSDGLEKQVIKGAGTDHRLRPLLPPRRTQRQPELLARRGASGRRSRAGDPRRQCDLGRSRGAGKAVTLDDIVIITPYNAQVFEIQQRLPGARVGTVDKFQGQEAPIAIYSTATSSHADAPRGMEFLYSLNRLNVATSRAKCVSILVGSPQIFEAECRTPRQIQLANAFCRYLEMAKSVAAA